MDISPYIGCSVPNIPTVQGVYSSLTVILQRRCDAYLYKPRTNTFYTHAHTYTRINSSIIVRARERFVEVLGFLCFHIMNVIFWSAHESVRPRVGARRIKMCADLKIYRLFFILFHESATTVIRTRLNGSRYPRSTILGFPTRDEDIILSEKRSTKTWCAYSCHTDCRNHRNERRIRRFSDTWKSLSIFTPVS